MLHDLLVLKSILIAISSFEPVGQGFNNLSDVVIIECKVEIFDITSLIEEWLIDEVPSTLVLSTGLTLDKVGISCALSEWMMLLILSPVWICIFESCKDR
jgi:hypothetical protein